MGADCLQLCLWWKEDLKEETPGFYQTIPPKRQDDLWSGYYIEMVFEGDTDDSSLLLSNEFRFTTPGYTWPTRLPFPDCNSNEGTCLDRMV